MDSLAYRHSLRQGGIVSNAPTFEEFAPPQQSSDWFNTFQFNGSLVEYGNNVPSHVSVTVEKSGSKPPLLSLTIDEEDCGRFLAFKSAIEEWERRQKWGITPAVVDAARGRTLRRIFSNVQDDQKQAARVSAEAPLRLNELGDEKLDALGSGRIWLEVDFSLCAPHDGPAPVILAYWGFHGECIDEACGGKSYMTAFDPFDDNDLRTIAWLGKFKTIPASLFYLRDEAGVKDDGYWAGSNTQKGISEDAAMNFSDKGAEDFSEMLDDISGYGFDFEAFSRARDTHQFVRRVKDTLRRMNASKPKNWREHPSVFGVCPDIGPNYGCAYEISLFEFAALEAHVGKADILR